MAAPSRYESLSDFALNMQHDDFPASARQRTVDAITDCIGCALGGTKEPLADCLLDLVEARRPPGDATASILFGTNLRASAYDAALYNGALCHALDYDDTNHPAHAHTSAVLVPALLAVAASERISGQDLVSAYIVGFEVFGKLGRAVNPLHYRRGWHTTATFGSIAAAVAVGRLLRLPPDQLETALGIAASSTGGLRANFGTMTKPLHAGFAARNGVFAALLARRGFTATREAFTHRFGFIGAFDGGHEVDTAALSSWGDPLEMLTQYGISLKPYPSCAGTHPAIEAASQIREDIKGDVDRIASIRVGTSEGAFQPLIYVNPATGLEGKFSMHYCVASALIDGDVTLETFGDERVAAPGVQRLIERTVMEVDERVRDSTEFGAAVAVTMQDGRRYERLVELAMGKPERWFTSERIQEKFTDCATRAISPAKAGDLFTELRALDTKPDLLSILDLLTAGAEPVPAMASTSAGSTG